MRGIFLMILYQIFIKLYQMLYAFFQWCRPLFLAESLNLTGAHG